MYKKILIPISFDEDRDAEGALKIAQNLLDADGHITLIHVIEVMPGFASSHLPPDFVTKRHAQINAELDTLASTIPGATGVVVSGHAGRAVLDWAHSNDTDCIVIASHRPGMQDLLLGSTACKVVRHATCAVHVLR